MGLAGAPGADSALLALQVLPHACQPGQQVFVLGQRHLEPPFAGAGPFGENVQNQGGAVHDGDAQLFGKRPLLGGGQGIVKDDNVRPQALDQLPDLLRFALADEGAGVGGGLVLQHRAQADAPRRVQKGGQLLQGFVRGVLLPGQVGGVEAHQYGAVDLFYFGFVKHKIPLYVKYS